MFVVRTGKHIDGSWFYETEDGQEMSRQQFVELQNAIPGEVKKQPLTRDEQRARYNKEFESKFENEAWENNINLDDENELNKILTKAKNESALLMGDAPVQNASPRTKQRMAGTAPGLKPILLGSRDLEAIQRPWELTQAGVNSPDFVGYSEDTWRMRNDETLKALKRMKFGDRASFSDMDSYLRDERGFGVEAERERVIKNLTRDNRFDSGRFLRTELYGVPHAYADEELSMAMLRGSGFKPVQAFNEEYVTGTDISAFIGNEPYKVDAQARTSRSRNGRPPLSLGVIMGDNNVDPDTWERILRNNPDTSLLSLIEQESANRRGLKGDKLLHTNDSNWNVVNPELFDSRRQKDYIITSSRPNTARFDRVGRIKRGPYDRQLPNDWALVDMNKAREQLLTKSYNQLQAEGVNTLTGRGGLTLSVPESYISSKLTNMDIPLDPRVVKQLTRRR
jgi:hypothetical protein